MVQKILLSTFVLCLPLYSQALQPPLQDPSASRRGFFQDITAASVATASGASTSLWLPSSRTAVASESALLPSSNLKLPPIGVGCWAWGDTLFWGKGEGDEELKKVFDYTIANTDGPVLLDTAELYGFGKSEQLIGQFSKEYPPERTIIASKFAAFPYRTKPESVVKACEASVKRLGRPIDLYQVHFPNAWSNAEYWDGMAMCYDKGLIKAVGVSNYGVDAIRACANALAKHGIPLSTNQIQYSLLYKFPEENGLLQACEDLGITVLSYSPMALGLLTGKYNEDKLPEGPRKTLFEKTVSTPEFKNLIATMKEIANSHNGTVAQVAINWTRAKGTIPIPGARTVSQAKSNLAALSWNLSKEEVAVLDKAASIYYIDAAGSPFPKEDINTKLKMFDS